MPLSEREQQVKTNVKIHHHRRDTWYQAYIDYRDAGDNVVATTLLTGGAAKHQDRDKRGYRPDLKLITDLAKSVRHGRLVVFHDQLQRPAMVDGAGRPVEFIQVPSPQINVFFARHQYIWSWLRHHPEVGKIWAVDGTDVTVNPHRNLFDGMESGRLYLGWEPKVVADSWMVDRHREPRVSQFLKEYSTHQLLNMGIIGGDRDTVGSFLHQLYGYAYDTAGTGRQLDQGDMGAGNWIAYTRYAEKIITGSTVASVFKQYEKPDNNRHSRLFHK